MREVMIKGFRGEVFFFRMLFIYVRVTFDGSGEDLV